MMGISPRGTRDDDGYSLVELVVAGAITVILGAVLGSILIAGMTATAEASDRDVATGRVQAISTDLSTAIRNATSVSLSADGTVVRARVATGRSAFECRAWAIVDLQTFSSSGAVDEPDGILELRTITYADGGAASPTASWGVLARDVQRVAVSATPAPATPSFRPFFSLADKRLTWTIGVGEQQNARLGAGEVAAASGAAVARAHQDGVIPTCS